MSELVLIDIRDGIASIRLNRPEALNALNADMGCALRAAVTRATTSEDVRVIVLSGAGRAFCAGGDLGYFRAAGHDAPEASRVLIEPMHAAIAALAAAKQPVIGELRGAVAGAGMSLAMATDLAIAADDAVFTLAYVKVAATPDCSGSWSLPRLVGLRKALEMALLGDRFDAAEALRLNLVNRVVPAGALEDESRKLARRLADAAPLAVQGIKRLLRGSLTRNLDDQMAAEHLSFAALSGTADFREALVAFFEKRPPNFLGR